MNRFAEHVIISIKINFENKVRRQKFEVRNKFKELLIADFIIADLRKINN